MARRIYLVELEVEADDKSADGREVPYGTFLPTHDALTEDLMKMPNQFCARMGRGWSVEAVEVIGTREG